MDENPELEKDLEPIACSDCFRDHGLRLDAQQIGGEHEPSECPQCGSLEGVLLDPLHLNNLAHRFFVWGTLHKPPYGAAPLVAFNKHQKSSISLSDDLRHDASIFEDLLGIGFFHYGPRLWMIGEVEPLEDLLDPATFPKTAERILAEFPSRTLDERISFYRVRKAPANPDDPHEYDSPPGEFAGGGRLDSTGDPVLYASPDLETCVHECRVTAEDDLYVATLIPERPLELLDLSVLLEEDTTEFESLDIAINMLFLAGSHSYEITRKIASAAKERGYAGIIYPSYFSLLRLGIMPFRTIYGISVRKIAQYQGIDFSETIPNLALFGRPIREKAVRVACINRLILNRVQYDFHFGPATIDA